MHNRYLLLLTITFYGCELVGNLDEVDTGSVIPIDQVVTDVNSAELVVIGAYSTLKSRGYASLIEADANAGISGSPVPLGFNFAKVQFRDNAITIENRVNNGLYAALYATIQQANLGIQVIGNATDAQVPAANKASFIAELKYLRATSHFYLLRFYGQHYDLNSAFGITIKTKPSVTPETFPRNTVQESYDAIIADLDDVIANGPTPSVNFRTNKEVAQALKANVLLYMGRYAEAATLANTVITSTSKTFAPDMVALFKSVSTSNEVFFAPFNNFKEDQFSLWLPINTSNFFGQLTYYATIGGADPRFAVAKGFSQFTNFANLDGPQDRTSHIHMRLAGLYLIHAEAAARAGSGVNAAALASLNAVRTRAGVGLPAVTPADKAALLEAIRLERLLELRHEGFGDFFDLVRYHVAGDLIASTIKPTLDNVNKFIFPIPLNERRLSNGQVAQNPGYPENF